MSGSEFQRIVEPVLNRYRDTPLFARWQEATAFGAEANATAFWIRDSADVVNIVWLNSDGIRDLTFVHFTIYEAVETDDDDEPEGQPSTQEHQEAMFNFVPLGSIVTFEVREGEDVAGQFRLGVRGHLLVHVVLHSAPIGNIYWVADSQAEAESLRSFVSAVLSAYVAHP